MTTTTAKPESILVPLDGSAESNAALPLARTLANAIHASIKLLRVLPEDASETTDSASSGLGRIASELAASGVQVASSVRRGRVAEEILSEIRELPATLVVMRTHGRSGVERVILGSVTDEVLPRCPVPLVLMRPGERRVTAIRTLLVPVDGSPGGAFALGAAVALARSSQASIKLVQVAVPLVLQTMGTYEYSGMGYYDPDWDEEALAGARAYVDGLVTRLRNIGLNAEGQAFMAANPAQGIADAAARDDVDLVVMSTRALTGPARTLLGSVANSIVRNAHCPVMLVHRNQAAADEAHGAATQSEEKSSGA